jgi:hypothetical protein
MGRGGACVAQSAAGRRSACESRSVVLRATGDAGIAPPADGEVALDGC